MIRADDVCTTAAERDALAALRDHAGAAGSPIEQHSLRVLIVAEELARRAGDPVDRELLAVAAWLHDIGLYTGRASADAYVTDGRRVGEAFLDARGWPADRVLRCLDAIEHHHELVGQWRRGPEVEWLRRADLVEVSGGLIRFGLGAGWLRGLHAAVPARGFARTVARTLALAHRRNPLAIARIFRPPGAGSAER